MHRILALGLAIATTLMPARGQSPALASMSLDIVLNVGGSGPRPYVALWIEGPDGTLERTLRVWGTKPRYQRELRAWKAAGGMATDGISGATRPNGAYRVRWDGLGANGRPLTAGPYVLRAECVREEGLHSQVRMRIPTGGVDGTLRTPGDGDILSLELSPADSAEPRP